MYRGEDFGGSKGEFGRYHRLAEAIRRGCELRPKKATGSYLGWRSACALGAAMCGVGEKLPRKDIYLGMTHVFPELNDPVWYCGEMKWVDIGSAVVTLNEGSDLSREEIAGWLCRFGGCEHEILEDEIEVIGFSRVVVLGEDQCI